MKTLHRIIPAAILLLALALGGCRGRQDQAPLVVMSIHLQTSEVLPSRLTRPVQLKKPPITFYVKSTSELTERMLERAEIDNSAGGPYVRFVFGDHGRIALRSLTTEFRNRYLVFFINGQAVAAHYITHTINDGTITMFADLPEDDVKKIVAGLRSEQLQKIRNK
jgi:hypothetical protein